ncbi:uncharacterized protein TNCV_4700871 [Trichonephila clavipes]|nr:uncharacterized protein TNCV_4700871 [Trichonephila clavipes]
MAEALDLPCSTVQKIMRNILRYYPYKLQLVQELLLHDLETRHLFSLQFLARLEADPEWPLNILWIDKAHFHLDGSVNTHNCQISETDNPHSTLQVPLHSPKIKCGSHLKQLVSCDQPRTLPDLKDSISQHVFNISQNTLWSTVEHAILRFQVIAENDGHHVEHLLL